MPAKPSDNLTPAGAASLAVRIREYWHQRGVDISTWVECEHVKTSATNYQVIYVVKSDLAGKQHSQVQKPPTLRPRWLRVSAAENANDSVSRAN